MTEVSEKLLCYHCGEPCESNAFSVNDKNFCCYGCKVVYELIEENDLCQYYDIGKHPGLNAASTQRGEYDFLNDAQVRKKLLEFDTDGFSRIRFKVPAIHCSSCIWLLENLQKADKGILRSEVNFNRKEVRIDFNPTKTDLARIASTLDALGYAPRIDDRTATQRSKSGYDLVFRLVVAGFAFGNVMLFSFPEYLGLNPNDEGLARLFQALNLALSVPVLLYSAADYFKSALRSFRQRQINIDVPIALGLIALFFRSTYDILSATGPGYLDSFTGLVFFLLIGRWFQGRTYESMAFDRDFRSFFPLAVQRLVDGKTLSTLIFDLKKGDIIRVRNLEIVPADSILMDQTAFIDYSFVTGEARPVKATSGDLIYAGGRLIGEPVKLVVNNETSQSHLTTLWNSDAFRKKYESRYKRMIDRSARIFTWVVLGIAFATWIYWYFTAPSQMWLVLTSVLMVACPCALALAAPFTYGSMLRAFGLRGFYLKNADVIERLGAINTIVFDKTGTVTHGQMPEVTLTGYLTDEQLGAVRLLTSYSTHPLSSVVNRFIKQQSASAIHDFFERPGQGISGIVNGCLYKVGSAEFVGFTGRIIGLGSRVFVSIDNEVKGYFSVQASIRQHLKAMLYRISDWTMAMLSGDVGTDERVMRGLFPPGTQLRYNQQPVDKMNFISELQSTDRKVLMVGDGLNDAGALKQADVGIAVTDDTGLFTPGCDGILQGDQLQNLDKFLQLAKKSTRILKVAFAISFLYNAVALTFAVTGYLTPLVAAILMPISSISVVTFSTVSVNLAVRRTLKS